MANNDKELLPFELPMNGKLVTAADPTEIGTNFQSLKNLRPYRTRKRGIGGMTKINANTALTDKKVRGAFHFKKSSPSAESHVLIAARNAGETTQKIYSNEAAIPATGDFDSTSYQSGVFATDSAGFGLPRFSEAPQDAVAYASGKDTKIWGGFESRVGGFINYDDADTFSYDYTDNVNGSSSAVAKLFLGTSDATKARYYVGFTRAIRGIKFYIGTANTSTSSPTINMWNGAAWVTVGAITDGTETGGDTSLGQTGTMTFASTFGLCFPSAVDGVFLYWYQVIFDSTPDNTTTITQVTVDAAFQGITDMWDGEYRQIASCVKIKTIAPFSTTDFSTHVAVDEIDPSNEATYLTTGATPTTDNTSFELGFNEPMMGIIIKIRNGKENATTSTLVVKYNADGAATWTAVNGKADGSIINTDETLGQTGLVTWSPSNSGSEHKHTRGRGTVSGNAMTPLWTYQLTFSADLSQNVHIYYIAGIPVPKTLDTYKFPFYADDCLWLCSNQVKDSERNAVTRSATSLNAVFNGSDTYTTKFGGGDELVGAASLYNRLSDSLIELKIFFKNNETWGLSGSTPSTYKKFIISSTVGCIAPNTIKTTTMKTEDGGTRDVVIWQGANGIYMYDGTTLNKLSADIDNFFDRKEANARKLHASYSHLSYSDVDEREREYRWMIADGTSTGTDNREFAFSLDALQWFEIDRSTGLLQVSLRVEDTNGLTYNYGFIETGYMERLENGTDFDGVGIDWEYWFGDFMLDPQIPHQELTIIRQLKLLQVAKTNTNDVTVTVYGDGKTAATDTFTLSPNKSGFRVTTGKSSKKQHMLGKAIFHSLKFEQSTDDETYGQEPIHASIFYKRVGEDY